MADGLTIHDYVIRAADLLKDNRPEGIVLALATATDENTPTVVDVAIVAWDGRKTLEALPVDQLTRMHSLGIGNARKQRLVKWLREHLAEEAR